MKLVRTGDTGEPVRDIQVRLAALGHPCEPDVEGTFGATTRNAVLAFQRSRGLAPDGIIGPDTWRAMVAARYALGDRLLYRRAPMMRGDDIAELQRCLNSLGFDSGKADGIFGPETLHALLDFQRNRGMAEDGIAGPVVATELDLMARATKKPGRDRVRDRQWVLALPKSLVGLRIYVDTACRDDEEAIVTWEAASEAGTVLQHNGAIPVFSRSEDTRPTDRVRAVRSNRLGVDLVIGFALPKQEPDQVKFFGSELSRSEAGEILATSIASELGCIASPATIPMLKETRQPAVIVVSQRLDRSIGAATVRGLQALLASEDRLEVLSQETGPGNAV